MTDYEIERSDELYHYGRKGMKWGQHIFGKVKTGTAKAGRTIGSKVSAAGKKMAESIADKHRRRKAEKLRAKPLRKLTDEELKERIKRLGLEKQAVDIMRQNSDVEAKAVSTGKKILSKAATDVLAPTLVNVGKKWLTKALEDKLNLSDVDAAMDKLATKAKKAGFERTIAEAKAAIKKANDGDPNSELAEQAKIAGYESQILDRDKKKLDFEKALTSNAQSNKPEDKPVNKPEAKSDNKSDSVPKASTNSNNAKVEKAIKDAWDADLDSLSESELERYSAIWSSSIGDIDSRRRKR